MEPRRRRRPGGVRQHLRRPAGLDLIRAPRFSLPTFNWLRYPEGDDLMGRDPAPGWPLDDVLDAAAAAGFASVGLDLYTLRAYVEGGGRFDRLGEMLRSRGLACSDVGVLPIGAADVLSTAEELARVASVVDSPTCIAAFFAPLERAEAIRQLGACADILREAGARLALEFASYGGLTRMADAVELCKAVGWERCGLLVDTWHFFRTGAPWPVLRALDAEQIGLVHVNDGLSAAAADPVHDGRFQRLPVGAGSFPLAEFATVLDEIGYRGTLSTEVLSDQVRGAPPKDGARTLLTALRGRWPQS